MKLNTNPITLRGHNKYLLELRQLSRVNRNNLTKAESILWYQVLRKHYLAYKFLRQKPINRFILDFYSSKLLLDIEVDGDSHDNKLNYDQGRDQILANIGIKTIRYTNNEVIYYLDSVLQDIKYKINQRLYEI